MTLSDGRYVTEDADEILDELVAAAEQSFGQELSEDELAVFRAFYEPVAEYLADQQDDLRTVLNSAQIDFADGQALDLLTALIGVSRKPARKATSRAQFSRNDPTGVTYTIPEGTVIETDAVEALRFVTTEASGIKFIDGFEDGNIDEYDGTFSIFNVSTTQAFEGNESLHGSGSGSIIRPDTEVIPDTTLHSRLRLTAGAVGGVVFGAEDVSNCYRVIVDADAGFIVIQVVDGGLSVDSSSTAASIPTAEWMRVDVEWKSGGEIVATVLDDTGTEIDSVTHTESNPTYEKGSVGFVTDSSNSAYWDNFTMSEVGVPIEAVEAGSEGNVGPGTLTVMADSPNGVESVTNHISATGGTEEESDDELRERAKDSLSEGSRSTLDAIATALENTEGVGSVTVIANDSSSTDAAGRPSHTFESVADVDPENYQDVAETIAFTKAAGDVPVGGYAGTEIVRNVTYETGQSSDIAFSIPGTVKIYVDVDLTKTGTYAGDDAVRDSIVQYIGGTLSTGSTVGGEISSGDDVIYNQVIEAIFDVEGVHDASNIAIGTSSSPTGTSNLNIGSTQVAVVDATDGSLTVDSTDV